MPSTSDLESVATLHREAMELADQAAVARRTRNQRLFEARTRAALEKESAAARLVAGATDLEPTRSVLHRSAASLALEAGEHRLAEQLISTALAAQPPDDIAEELRDLLEDVYFRRHLALRGVVLQPDEFQMSIEGALVGFGIAPTDQFVGRVRDVENLIYRTAERKLNRAFREAGRRQKALAQQFELYLSVPRAASFAVTFRIGRGDQVALPGLDFSREVLDDFLDCMELFDRSALEELQARIPSEPYFRNFVGLASKLAPDGNQVSMVGFTAVSPDGERALALSTPRAHIRERLIAHTSATPIEDVVTHVEGVLRFADALSQQQGKIEVVAADGTRHRLQVPRGMMSDVVKPWFEENVLIQARQRGDQLMLETIELADEVNPDV